MYQLSYVEYYQMFTLSAFIFFPNFHVVKSTISLSILSKKTAYKIVKDRVSVPGGQNTGKTQVINY